MNTPLLQALLVADHVYQDRQTGKYVICGIFSALRFIPKRNTPPASPDEPVPAAKLIRAGSPFVYLSVTELRGQRSFELRYMDLSNDTVLFTTTFQIQGQNPLDTVEVALPLPVLPTPHEGVYALELLCDNTPLGSHRVRVVPDPNFPKPE